MTTQPTPPATGAAEHEGPIRWNERGTVWELRISALYSDGKLRPDSSLGANAATLVTALSANPQLRAAARSALQAESNSENYWHIRGEGAERREKELRELLRLAESQLAEVRSTFEERLERYRKFACDVQERIDTEKPPHSRLFAVRDALVWLRAELAQQPAPPPVERAGDAGEEVTHGTPAWEQDVTRRLREERDHYRDKKREADQALASALDDVTQLQAKLEAAEAERAHLLEESARRRELLSRVFMWRGSGLPTGLWSDLADELNGVIGDPPQPPAPDSPKPAPACNHTSVTDCYGWRVCNGCKANLTLAPYVTLADVDRRIGELARAAAESKRGSNAAWPMLALAEAAEAGKP